MKLLLIFLLVVQILGQQKVRYDGYQVFRVSPNNRSGLRFLLELEQNPSDITFWTPVKSLNQHLDLMVPTHKIEEFKSTVKYYNINSKIIISDVQELIDNEKPKIRANEDFGWTDYYTLEEINAWLSSLAETYPETVSLVKGGTSYEGRDIIGVHVSFSPDNENRTVFVESNIHACEWISSAVSTYILNQLLTSTDSDIRQVAQNYDWYFFPVFNVDGFVYTHTTDRLWRKTRVPYGNCTGTDPNRNWNYHYDDGGSDNDPCSEYYKGPEAFSEPSMKSLSEFIASIGDKLNGYINLHSYSQILLLPYGYTTEHLDNYDELYEVGLKAIEALTQRYGTQYEIGEIAEIMYVASGSTLDWVKGNFGTRITYGYELRDTGEHGFILPADQILPTAEETFDSFITIFREFAEKS